MQSRSTHWFAWRDTADAARSGDGWTRLRVGLDRKVAERRSWALDPASAGERTWTPVDLAAGRNVPTAPDRRVYSAMGPVEGKSNPHEDTRGIVVGSAGGRTCSLAVDDGDESMELFIARSRDGIRVDLPLDPACRVYGLGEKSGGLDKRGRTWVFWNTDDPVHQPERDPLYQSIPVAFLFRPGRVVTVFSDSPAIQFFDVGESDASRLRVEVYDDAAELYLRCDESLASAVTAYTGLTGRMPLPPAWALGFQQCRYSYYPDRRVIEIAERMRTEQVPCDVIYLDIHYMDGYRVFTWDPERFPDPESLIRALDRLGLRVVTIIDPGVKVDSGWDVYADGLTRSVFLTRSDGSLYVGRVWPGEAVFPDFSRSDVRSWWAEWHERLLATGIAGIWNDMNEPADFSGNPVFRPDFTVPNDVAAGNDGRSVPFARVHNAYASGMNEATRLGLSAHRPHERGFVLTRAGYAGIQRHAAVWTGDNHSWWEHVALMTPMLLNLGLSGVAFCGADTGGFSANASRELFARWFEASCLMPFFRAHSVLDSIDHEPWSFGPQALDIVRAHVGLRYQLMPYLYTLFEESSRTGAPVVRPLVYHYPQDPLVADRADCFLLGPALLVAPVRERGVTDRSVYLPAGTWYDFHTGERHQGGGAITAHAPIDRLPLYVRGGSIIPYEAVRMHTDAPGDGVLRLLVAPDRDGTAVGELYADAGEGYAYRAGEYWRTRFVLSESVVRYGAPASTGGREAAGGAAVPRWLRIAATVVGRGLPTDTDDEADIAAGELSL